MTAFEEMGVLPELGVAVDEMEWTLPTDVQSEAIPIILGGGDVLMAAETGSGKTGAFCLPVIQIVWETLRDIQSGKLRAGGAKGGKGEKKWLLNVYDRGDQMAITPEGLLCQSRDPNGWHGARANKGVVNNGRYQYEATVTDDGLCRVGFSTAGGTLELGIDKNGYGFGGTGKKSWNRQFDTYGESFTNGDTIGCLLDLDAMQITFAKNGRVFPPAFDIAQHLRRDAFFPAVVLKNAEMSFNFGQTPFKHPIKGHIPLAEADKDNVVESQTGGASSSRQPLKPAPNAPMCIIIEPSYELAEQTYTQIEKFKKHLGKPEIGNVLCVGGRESRQQLEQIRRGVDIVTGTPGRLNEFIQSGELCLSQVRFFVLDEADGLLSSGYTSLINKVHALIPKLTPDGRRLQMVVCSATLHNFEVKKLANSLMHYPQWVDLKGADTIPDTVHHVVVMCNPVQDKRWIRLQQHVQTDGVHAKDQIRAGSEQTDTLSEGVKRMKGHYVLQAIRSCKMDRAIIFCRTKIDCDNMERWLMTSDKSLACVCLHSDRSPPERKENLQKFKDGKARFLICTDVAARGIDVRGIPFVINVTLPDDKANYLHRIGRVGRAERMGLAISLVSSVKEKVWYHGCPSRGKSCNNTRLTTQGGCCIWYDERLLLGEIEENTGCTIQQIDADINVPIDEFDGKVTYGDKRRALTAGAYKGHSTLLADTVRELAVLEKATMTSYLSMGKCFD